MYVVAHLLGLVPEDAVLATSDRALREIREKAVEHRAGVIGTREAPAAETGGFEPEVATVLLNQHVGGNLRGAEYRVCRVVERHLLVDADEAGMLRCDLPPSGTLDERKTVRRVAVDLVGGREDEWR